MTGARSALLAVEVAFVLGLGACFSQMWVIRENWLNFRAVRKDEHNGNLRLIAAWELWISPFVLGLFVFLTFLALTGIRAGLPEQVTAFGLVVRWSYSAIMAICVAWSIGGLLVRRGLSDKNDLLEGTRIEGLRRSIQDLERRVEELTAEVNRRPTRDQLLADNEILEALVRSLRGRLQSEGTG